jgi:hypothetical protein
MVNKYPGANHMLKAARLEQLFFAHCENLCDFGAKPFFFNHKNAPLIPTDIHHR